MKLNLYILNKKYKLGLSIKTINKWTKKIYMKF